MKRHKNCNTIAKVSSDLCVAIICSENPVVLQKISMRRKHAVMETLPWPLWPRIVSSPCSRRLRQQFEICYRLGTVAHGCTNTVVSCISTANNNDILPSGIDVAAILKFRVEKRLRVQLEFYRVKARTPSNYERNIQRMKYELARTPWRNGSRPLHD